MALTNAEKVKRYRDRQKAKKELQLKRAEHAIPLRKDRRAFFEAFQEEAGSFSDFHLCFDTAGLPVPQISDDSDPKSLTGEVEQIFIDSGNQHESPYANGGGSLARAEIMVGCLIDAAGELARIINGYKRDEIDARIAEIEQSDLSDADTKKKAFADMARLKKMRDQLDKQVRWTFPQWKVTGE
jgi:hypothetical protein